MSNKRTATTLSIDVHNNLGQSFMGDSTAISIQINTHTVNPLTTFSNGIISTAQQHLTLDEAKELVDKLSAVIADVMESVAKPLWECATNDDRWTGCEMCSFKWLEELGVYDYERGKNYINEEKGIFVAEDVFHELSVDVEHNCLSCGVPLL